ncbi:PREDICTED: mitochondrial ubiquitin ligase activator of nfkb 1-A-like [Nanorana parkeri]|uniref:mitochondrial ubiquitin ligase activator of nfkb 1-A-like n=1 Tax=Nanorana parkeri TaxID=125878 RepID=UPI000854890E|nr:PREDICTED: mitochondrial ubiquitin ligase activator of nfkb 1-A-like [Nanorana parkeri]
MELSGLETLCGGSSLAFTSLFYYLYRRQRAAVCRIQAAPRLQVSADLRRLMETTREMSYVALEGRVEAVGNAISSENHPHLQAVIQKHQMVEHRLFWNSLTSSWSEYVRVIYERVKEIPFQLCPLEGDEVSVLVCDPQNASGLTLQIVHEKFNAASLNLSELLGHYFSGEKPTGLLETEEILPVGTILTGVGKLTLNHKGEMTLEPPENGSTYFLSLSGYEDILHQQESLAKIWRGAALFFGALGAVVVCIAMYRAYQRYKEKHKRQDHLDEQRSQTPDFDEEPADPERLCVICISRTRECVILPCGHVCCCFFCYQALPNQMCPICRCSIERVVPLFQV